MGFNSAFKGLMFTGTCTVNLNGHKPTGKCHS